MGYRSASVIPYQSATWPVRAARPAPSASHNAPIGIQPLTRAHATRPETTGARKFRPRSVLPTRARVALRCSFFEPKGGRMATVETPTDLFVHKLGATLTMEETILEMLEELQDKAADPKLQKQLQQHHTETVQQIQNLRRIFDALGEPPE